MSEAPITIRTLSAIEEYEQAEAIQRDIWGLSQATAITPLHVLLTAQDNGGLVAAAFDAGQMVGFLFGFIGLTPDGKFKHCSHQMGIWSAVRRKHVGRALKLFQRDYVLRQGFDLITWTFDPLESVNASLNIARLGAVTNTYFPNHYGNNMDDGLNKDLPTDRFQVDWWIKRARVERFIAGQREQSGRSELLERGARVVIDTRRDPDGILRPIASRLDLDADTLLVEVPPEFQAIKIKSMDLAREWRHITGAVFIGYFERGYSVTDFISETQDQGRANFYVLTRDPGSVAT